MSKEKNIRKGMSDPNALAWKGTPGPWEVGTRQELYEYVIYCKSKGVKVVASCWINTRIDENTSQEDIKKSNIEKAKANAYMISAAPEAIEFIADLMPELDLIKALGIFDPVDVDKLISSAEEILKKAYNH